jgi:hypothetical protein
MVVMVAVEVVVSMEGALTTAAIVNVVIVTVVVLVMLLGGCVCYVRVCGVCGGGRDVLHSCWG